MYKEKHVIKKVYGNHKLSRYADVYEVNTINCSASSLSGFIDRSLVMTAGGIPQPRFFNADFDGWSCIMSGITMRTFDSYGDAYNFVQLWP